MLHQWYYGTFFFFFFPSERKTASFAHSTEVCAVVTESEVYGRKECNEAHLIAICKALEEELRNYIRNKCGESPKQSKGGGGGMWRFK